MKYLYAAGFCLALSLVACEDVRRESYDSGKVRSQCPYENDLKQGLEKRYYEDGSPEAEQHFVRGVAHGSEKAWHPNGRLRLEQNWVEGRLDGPSLLYHPNGKLARRALYGKGKETAFASLYDSLGSPLRQGEVTDVRDLKKYPWVRIGSQVWLAANLDFAFAQGDLCLQCSNWGRLYDLASARQACPAFFHLPSKKEWMQLLKQAGSSPGRKLKAKWGWDPLGDGLYGNGEDSLGFAALSGGGHFAGVSTGKQAFQGAGQRAYFWTSEGELFSLYYRDSEAHWEKAEASYGFSVRCVLDETQVP